jgi:hypothetical protein
MPIIVKGKLTDDETRCIHYHSPSNSGVVILIIPAGIAMRKKPVIKQLSGVKLNLKPQRSYVVFANRK